MIAMLDPERETAGPGATGSEGARAPRFHEPVLLSETLAALQPAPGKILVDATLGGGGHAQALLEQGADVFGLDQDGDAVSFAKEKLVRFGARFQALQANFSGVDAALATLGVTRIDGALIDLGVSSWQLDSPERGFSFLREGPLDMRMNRQAGTTAAELVNSASAEELEDVFRQFGEEPAARRIAARIVSERARQPFETTTQLARAVSEVVPRHGRAHPATRIFQALRISVNRELEALAEGLRKLAALLAPGGRFAVITFHSLEDRIVKSFFKKGCSEWLDRPEWPEPRRNPGFVFRPVTGKPVIAGREEQKRNPRSRSAKLRVVERIQHGGQ